MVGLSSSVPSLSVPASVTIPLNSSSATFTATAGALSSDQTATITATLNSSSKSATLSLIAPPKLSDSTLRHHGLSDHAIRRDDYLDYR